MDEKDTLESRKRRRLESVEKAKDEPKDSHNLSGSETKPKDLPTPAYGSKEYWEGRYKNEPVKLTPGGEDDPEAYHAWYFKFEDLAPLLLPLIITDFGDDDGDEKVDDDGDDKMNTEKKDEEEKNKYVENKKDSDNERNSRIDNPGLPEDQPKVPLQQNSADLKSLDDVKDDDENQVVQQINFDTKDDEKEKEAESDKEKNGTEGDKEENGTDCDEKENSAEADKEENCTGREKDGSNAENDQGDSEEGSYEEIEGFELTEVDDDDEGSVMIRPGLAKNGPISVLEVGCGDAPLGQDLAASIEKYGRTNGEDPSTIIQKIICSDYSKNVIDKMNKEQKEHQSQSNVKEKGVLVKFEEGDARKLCYGNESFEIILEKGTLDAMLSDDEEGQKNCRKIVSECARVLAIGGYIVIISHLNAYVESGMHWLNNVIVPGLRAAGDFDWLIEIHASDVEVPSDNENETEEENEIVIESPGPAVYFIEKVGILKKVESSDDGAEESMPTIPLKFFSY